MKQYEKQKEEEFNGILNASVRTKKPSSDKAMPHDQRHWLFKDTDFHTFAIHLGCCQ